MDASSDAYPLSDEQIAFYRDNGYVQLHDVLTPAELDETRRTLDDANSMALDPQHHLSAGRPEYERIFVQKVNLWTVHEGMRRYVFNHKIAEIARRLAGTPRVRLWHDHALIKMPEDSKPSAWHQDLPYWPMDDVAGRGALSCWMALDDVDERNGCMQFVPRSHSWGRFEPINLIDAQSIFALVPDADNKDFTPAVMAMPAGSCTFHNGLTFHYAGPNRSDRPRRAMVTIYIPEGVTYSGRKHVVTDPLDLQPGDLIAGDIFPVLAESA